MIPLDESNKLDWFYREISWSAMWHTSRELDEIYHIMFGISCACSVELGLRWLHDRAEEDNQSNFVDVIKSAFPSIMTGIAHGLVLESQQRLTDELKGDRTTMRKLHKRARELTKRRKKRIP